jgi:hypothetical protein
MCNAQQPPCYWAQNDTIKYTTGELLDIVTPHTTNEEAIGPLPIPGGREAVPSSSQAAPSGIAIQDAKKNANDNKKRRKRHP